jgi:hypothetical protein
MAKHKFLLANYEGRQVIMYPVDMQQSVSPEAFDRTLP